jgi:hypothetical protein
VEEEREGREEGERREREGREEEFFFYLSSSLPLLGSRRTELDAQEVRIDRLVNG